MDLYCKNCGYKVSGNFCSNCSQSTATQRITHKDFLSELLYGFTSWNRGFFYTLKCLITRPGYMMSEYIEGKRVRYYRPLGMLVILATMYGVLCFIMNIEADNLVTINAGSKSVQHIINWINHTPFKPLAMFPLYALISLMIFRRVESPKYNFSEYLFIYTFIYSQSVLIAILLAPVKIAIQNETLLLILSFAKLLFLYGVMVWDFKQIFGLGLWKTLLKVALVYLYTIVAITILIFLIATVIALFGE